MAFIDSGQSFDKDENYEKMKKRMENLETQQYPLRIPKHLYKKVKIKLVKENKNLRQVLLEALENYLNDETKK